MCILKGGKTVCLTLNKVVPRSLDIWHGIGNITVLKYDFIKKPNYITLKSTSNPSIWRTGKWENLLILSSDGLSAIANPQSIQMEHLVLNSHVLLINQYLFVFQTVLFWELICPKWIDMPLHWKSTAGYVGAIRVVAKRYPSVKWHNRVGCNSIVSKMFDLLWLSSRF